MKRTNRSTSFSYFELLDACREPGCPLCRLGHRSAQRHLSSLIYDGVNDLTLRATLRDSYGYCFHHAWLLPHSGESAPLGIAVIHRDILNTLRRRLAEEAYSKERADSLRTFVAEFLDRTPPPLDAASSRHLPARDACPACLQRLESEQLAFASLMEALDKRDEKMVAALESSEGLCLAHLRHALNLARTKQAFDALVRISQGQLTALLHDLDEFIRKNDHRFREERISQDEAKSWRRALQLVSGSKPDQATK